MKSVVKDKSKEVEYPCLMVSDSGAVILFNEHRKGVVVYVAIKHIGYRVGYYGDMWDMDKFTPFHGTVELSND